MGLVELERAACPQEGFSASKAWLSALELTSRIDDEPQRILPTVIDELADRFGDAPALLSDRESFSFRTLAERSNAYARWAMEQGLNAGGTVCLLMPNRPEYLAIWLGITRVGGVVALLNTNLAGVALAHCIAQASPEHIIVAAELVESLDDALDPRGTHARLWVHGAAHVGMTRIDHAVERYDGRPLTLAGQDSPRLSDRALCIYTSGTTGLPKAANVSHHRLMMWSYWFAGILQTRASDRLLNYLPMYHSVGGIVAIGSVLVSGGSVVIREKFSARRFWDDLVDWDCSLFQYIGELCRYLLKAPPSEHERSHRLRLCCGNGLRSDVWQAFKERFGIPHIVEFYAATEGTFSLTNVEGKPGSIGRVPAFLAHRFPAAIVKFDVERGEPVRDERGFCIRCARNEAGEAIGKIASAQLGARFEGYTSRAETEKKVLRNVFVEGDIWFRTGDLMRQDQQGFFYFVDRVGDTFRWKGENVSTFEVAEAVAACPGVIEASAYGVMVPGTEGRAGMAALVAGADFDLGTLRSHVCARLPGYARPLFLRICNEIETTETFKQKKTHLTREGFDPTIIADPLYFDDPESEAYVRLDHGLFERIAKGDVRL
jgi:fatty-acyl-CoA synthase